MSKTGAIILAFFWFLWAIHHAWFSDNSADHLAQAFIYFIAIMGVIVYLTKPKKKEVNNGTQN